MRWSLMILLMLLVSSEAARAKPGDSWRIAGDHVNLRRGPTTDAEIKRRLDDGHEVIERARNGEWYEVEVTGFEGLLGWVHHTLLRGSRPTSLPTPPPEPASAPAPTPDVEVREAFKEKLPPRMPPDDDEAVLDQMRDYVIRREKLPKEPTKPKAGRSGRVIISPVPIRKPGDQSRIPTELVLASSEESTGIDPDAIEIFRDSVSYLNSRAWTVAGIELFSEIEPVGGGVVQVKTTNEWFEVPKIGQASYLNTLLDRWASAKADGAPAGVMLVDPKGDLLMHQTKP